MNESPRVALIRGPHWQPWEYQTFAPLENRCRFSVFVTRSSANVPTARIERQALPSIGDAVARWHPKAAWFVEGVSSRLFGRSYAMTGLPEALRGFDILHALETYTTFSYQALLA